MSLNITCSHQDITVRGRCWWAVTRWDHLHRRLPRPASQGLSRSRTMPKNSVASLRFPRRRTVPGSVPEHPWAASLWHCFPSVSTSVTSCPGSGPTYHQGVSTRCLWSCAMSRRLCEPRQTTPTQGLSTSRQPATSFTFSFNLKHCSAERDCRVESPIRHSARLYKKDTPFGLDTTFGLVLFCINFQVTTSIWSYLVLIENFRTIYKIIYQVIYTFGLRPKITEQFGLITKCRPLPLIASR